MNLGALNQDSREASPVSVDTTCGTVLLRLET
jgi:hypothetical protein